MLLFSHLCAIIVVANKCLFGEVGMKICLMCDLHLCTDLATTQYKALDFAVKDILIERPDAVIYAGDVTCDGNAEVYYTFLLKMQSLGIPFFYIPGNSDLRDESTCDRLSKLASPTKNTVGDITVFAINDCDGTITDDELTALESADENSIVFMHRPMAQLTPPWNEKMLAWHSRHSKTAVFFGHKHASTKNGYVFGLQCIDPDKSIGEKPNIAYYDTETRELRKSFFFSSVPTDLYGYMGLSCYDIRANIELAIKHGLKNLELRKSCIDEDREELVRLIASWREAGGKNLSIHLPDVSYEGGEVVSDPRLCEYAELARILSANRFTQHVPKVSVKTVRENKDVLPSIALALSRVFNTVESDIVIGVENMHMTKKDTPDENRRFGYIPEECLEFINHLSKTCIHKVGFNFDIGHARNNPPYNQQYQISTWMSIMGKHIVGYHMHQVNSFGNGIENHLAFENVYSRLISLSSFFIAWNDGQINKAPVIFEMRPKDAYETTLNTFAYHKKRTVFDLHAHTYFSNCSEDDPRGLADAAVSAGLSLFAITDHRHGIKERVSEYVKMVRSLADEYKNRLRILCGIEIATLPYKFDPNVAEVVGDCDFCLIEHIDEPESTVGKNLFEFARSLGIRCGIAHTDLFKYCDIYGYDYLEFFRNLADAGIFWELNVNRDSTHNYVEHKYVRDFMTDRSKIDIIKKSGVYISIGFDSHIHEEYDAERVHAAYDFLVENEINTADKLFGGYEK